MQLAIIILSALAIVELFAILLLVAMVKVLCDEIHDMDQLMPIEIERRDNDNNSCY